MKTPKTLTDHEIATFLELVIDYRDRCMILIMLDAGLRVGEMVQLRQSDLYFHGCIVRQLVVRPEISKTKSERTIPLTMRLSTAIYLLKTQKWYKTGAIRDHFAFYTNDYTNHITSRQVERIVLHAGHMALGRRITPHMLRHTFGSKVLRKSNMRVAQELLGHKSIKTTQVYTHPNNQDKKDAIDGLAC